MVKPASKERESWCQPFSTTSPPESAKQKSCRIASLMFDLDVAVSTFIASLQQKDLLGYFLETEARTVFI